MSSEYNAKLGILKNHSIRGAYEVDVLRKLSPRCWYGTQHRLFIVLILTGRSKFPHDFAYLNEHSPLI